MQAYRHTMHCQMYLLMTAEILMITLLLYQHLSQHCTLLQVNCNPNLKHLSSINTAYTDNSVYEDTIQLQAISLC